MFFTTQFIDTILIPPSFLGHKLIPKIKEYTHKKLRGNCLLSDHFEFIDDVLNVDLVGNGKISRTSGYIQNTINITAKIIKIEIGDVLSGKIKNINKWGIFVQVHEFLKCLVKYSSPRTSFEETLEENQIITFKVTNIRKEPKGLSCIAQFI